MPPKKDQHQPQHFLSIKNVHKRSHSMKRHALNIPDIQRRRLYIDSIPHPVVRSMAMRQHILPFLPDEKTRFRYILSLPHIDHRLQALLQFLRQDVTDPHTRRTYIRSIPDLWLRTYVLRHTIWVTDDQKEKQKLIALIPLDVTMSSQMAKFSDTMPPEKRQQYIQKIPIPAVRQATAQRLADDLRGLYPIAQQGQSPSQSQSQYQDIDTSPLVSFSSSRRGGSAVHYRHSPIDTSDDRAMSGGGGGGGSSDGRRRSGQNSRRGGGSATTNRKRGHRRDTSV